MRRPGGESDSRPDAGRGSRRHRRQSSGHQADAGYGRRLTNNTLGDLMRRGTCSTRPVITSEQHVSRSITTRAKELLFVEGNLQNDQADNNASICLDSPDSADSVSLADNGSRRLDRRFRNLVSTAHYSHSRYSEHGRTGQEPWSVPWHQRPSAPAPVPDAHYSGAPGGRKFVLESARTTSASAAPSLSPIARKATANSCSNAVRTRRGSAAR